MNWAQFVKLLFLLGDGMNPCLLIQGLPLVGTSCHNHSSPRILGDEETSKNSIVLVLPQWPKQAGNGFLIFLLSALLRRCPPIMKKAKTWWK